MQQISHLSVDRKMTISLPNTLRVLVIDDDEMQYLLVSGYLGQVNHPHYQVDWAVDSHEAESLLVIQSYDVALLDYNLGIQDGLEVLQDLRQRYPTLPVIFMTGQGTTQVDLQAMAYGAVDYLNKLDVKPALLDRSLRYAVQRQQAFSALQRSEERLRQVLETVPAGVFIYQHQKLQYANPMVSVLTHYTVDELQALDLFDLIHPDVHATVRDWLPFGEHYYTPSQPETKFVTRTKRERWFSLTMVPIVHEGEPAILGAIVDATRRIRIEQELWESERRFRAMVEYSSDLIVQIGRDGATKYVSTSIEHVLGHGETAWLGTPLTKYIHPDEREIFQKAINQTINQKLDRQAHRIRIVKASGDWVWMDVTISNMLTTPELGSILLNMHDVTEQQKRLAAEQHQRAMSEALVDTFGALNSTLNFTEVIQHILKNVGRVIAHDRANIMLIEGDIIYVAAHTGYEIPAEIETLQFKVDELATFHQMIETQAPILIQNVAQHDTWVTVPHQEALHSYLGMPIIVDDTVIGFLNLESFRSNYFNDESVRYLRLFSFQASTAIRNSRAFKQARDLAGLEERQRLARELHDTVNQVLFSANIVADSLRYMAEPDSKIAKGLDTLQSLNKGALAEMRTLLMELRPQSIVDTQLSKLIQNLVNSMASRTQLTVTLNEDVNGATLPEEVHIGLYRIVQEALNNIIKHAHAKTVMVDLTIHNGAVEISIDDDGVGFDVVNIPADHHGVRIMHERAEQIGAALNIMTAPGNGTIIEVEWYPNEDHL